MKEYTRAVAKDFRMWRPPDTVLEHITTPEQMRTSCSPNIE